MSKGAHRVSGFGAGAIAAAAGYALATLCCIPIALGSLGVALAGAGAFFGPYRIWLGALAGLSLLAAFVQSYRRRCGPGDACERRPAMGRLWLMALIVAALLTSSAWSAWLTRPITTRAPGVTSLRQLSGVEELKAAFNRDVGRPRLVLLFSPT